MKLSTKTRYGARAAVEIARHYGKGPIKRKDIVQSQEIPDSYLENILIALKNGGIILTYRGAKGGYALQRPPAQITFLNIANALEGRYVPVDCLEDPEVCKNTARCATRPIWQKLQQAQENVLKSITLEHIIKNETATAGSDFCI
ncbi:MAG: Rrf2 family transcriptional regulator [Chitinivibrionales bacterium]|nr:Rrf2 family transcriptional regulator [Chitinivibrionales bacterium]